MKCWCCLLHQVWESAVNIAMNNKKERISDTVSTVAERLVQGSRHEAAAELLQGIDNIQGAVRSALLAVTVLQMSTGFVAW